MGRFFDDHPRFLETSETRPAPNRLNGRHDAIVGYRRDIYAGARVLDLGSHDGRWSFAALKAGAARAVGVEARPHLVRKAEDNFAHYGMDRDRYEFVSSDAAAYLRAAAPENFDVALCLGFFYHTAHHMELIAQFERVGARYIVIDTGIVQDERPIISMKMEETADTRMSIDYMGGGRRAVPVGIPSRAALVLMLDGAGYDTAFFPWSERKGEWTALEDYRGGTRVTAIAERRR